jgi:hypothetical protein
VQASVALMANYDRGARFALHLAKLRQSARPFWASTADITYHGAFHYHLVL